MQCIWATSLELTWGSFRLRMIIDNMHQWIREVVKPEVSRWIGLVRGPPIIQHALTPEGDSVTSSRRAKSCEPPSRRPVPTGLQPPKRTPPSKVTPTLLRGETAPDRIIGNSANHPVVIDSSGDESDSKLDRDEGYITSSTKARQQAKWSLRKRNCDTNSGSEWEDDGHDNDDDDDGDKYCNSDEENSLSDQFRTTPRRNLPRKCVSAQKKSGLRVELSPCSKNRRQSSRF